MDIRCKVCSEPIDTDEFHDIADELGVTFDKVRKLFYAEGCVGIGYRHNTDGQPNPLAAMLQDMMGDDIDGLAALTEDFD